MNVLGITGSFDRTDEPTTRKAGVHDSSAALIMDGEIVAAVEEERLSRYKHSGKLPLGAVGYCLQAGGISLGQVDRFVFNILESDINEGLDAVYRGYPPAGRWKARPYIQHVLQRNFGAAVDTRRMEFIDHHHAHAVSAFYPSGFDRSLVVTLDGVGAGLSGSVWVGEDDRLTPVRTYAGRAHDTTQSLGHFYAAVTGYLGFQHFDEYKVMGLAPYGDRARFGPLFRCFYALKDDGDYEIYLSRLDLLRDQVGPARRADEPVEQVHQDVAAALQEMLETIAFHLLQHHGRETGLRRLCLAGGVAHNCAMNGKILLAGLFDEVFVQPASHDGGLSLGAALYGHHFGNGNGAAPRRTVMRHALLGPEPGCREEIGRELALWSDYLEFRAEDDVADAAGALLAEGKILGWVQGRSEFGPRALGSRSIVADPRPAENKDIINAMIKKREAFRPFAPSVLEEEAGTYFELPPHQNAFSFMVFAVKVKEPFRSVLGAVTHVDGTARIQTVDRATNPRYWALIDAFRRRTGIPIVLNTSFNNNAEPIVNTARDAVVCFLTTGLDGLVLGDWVVRKKEVDKARFAALRPSLPSFVRIHQRALRGAASAAAAEAGAEPFYKELFARLYPRDQDFEHSLGNTHDARKVEISGEMASLLADADGYATLGELLAPFPPSEHERLIDEALGLWGRRYVRLLPDDPAPGGSAARPPSVPVGQPLP